MVTWAINCQHCQIVHLHQRFKRHLADESDLRIQAAGSQAYSNSLDSVSVYLFTPKTFVADTRWASNSSSTSASSNLRVSASFQRAELSTCILGVAGHFITFTSYYWDFTSWMYFRLGFIWANLNVLKSDEPSAIASSYQRWQFRRLPWTLPSSYCSV